jgi:threonine dehydrogenase-like Zn-dependent dehydrogenase
VVETGADVTEFSIGDRVYPPGKIACGGCSYCSNGYPEYRPEKETLGFHRPGALAEYVTAPEETLCRLPDDVSDAEGAALQPLAASVLCVHDAPIEMGDCVAVIGTGVMGSQSGQIALLHGAAEVFAVDLDSKRLEVAEGLGMTGVNANRENPVERIREVTDGIGADVVFEAVGGEQTHGSEGDDPMAQAYRTARRGGTVVQVGMTTSEVTFPPRRYRGRMVSWINPRDMVGTLSLGPNRDSGELAAELVETGRVTIDEYVTHGFDGLERFEDAIDVTLNKVDHDALGPAQLVLEEG